MVTPLMQQMERSDDYERQRIYLLYNPVPDEAAAILHEMLQEARAENERLREIINAVEWVADYDHTLVCPWCGRTRDAGHSESCIRRDAHEDQCSP